MDYALSGSYRLYEADIRVGIAWKYWTAGNLQGAKVEAEKAKQMSKEMGYYWGQVDAMEVIDKLESV